MTIYSIYKITNKINNKVYIGFTSTSIQERWYNHIANANSNKRNNKTKSAIQDAILKYGEGSFTIETLYQSKDKIHTINEMENYFITEHNSYIDGYNLTEGGDLPPGFDGRTHSEETKEKLRQANIGKKHTEETKRKMSITRKGVKRGPMSMEQREKISQAHIGKVRGPFTEEHKRKIGDAVSGKKNGMYGRSGETNPFYGKKHNEETLSKLRKPKEKFVCECCGKEVGGKPNYLRWHGDNCKKA